MAKRKSKAQIARMQKRAQQRGEVYVREEQETEESSEDVKEQKNDAEVGNEKNDDADLLTAPTPNEADEATRKRLKIAEKLVKELKEIEENKDLKAKDRRSAKRKAEAIAGEESGMPADELLKWFQEEEKKKDSSSSRKRKKEEKTNNNPYVIFVGQLSYDTTKEGLFQHFKEGLKEDHKISPHNFCIRLLTDEKTNKSRGMAFIEVDNPELLYACLKMHHTSLDGRRINVERSAGGGRETRSKKVKQFRESQEEYMEQIVSKLVGQYIKSGEMQENELDEGVIGLCKRHSASVVEAALERYVESAGRDMDNPSAYLSFLLGKFADEGIYKKDDGKKQKNKNPSSNKSPRRQSKGNDRLDKESEMRKRGVDMSMSEKKEGELSSIFPSMTRGRGR